MSSQGRLRTLRAEAGISLCYIRRLFSKSHASTPAHTGRRPVRTHAHVCTNTHGCTMKRPTFSVTLKKLSPCPGSNISLAIHVCMHMHLSRTHMFTCTYKVTLRVSHQNSMQVLPGNWELGGGVLICFSWTFSMATASWCEPVRRDTCGTLTQ